EYPSSMATVTGSISGTSASTKVSPSCALPSAMLAASPVEPFPPASPPPPHAVRTSADAASSDHADMTVDLRIPCALLALSPELSVLGTHTLRLAPELMTRPSHSIGALRGNAKKDGHHRSLLPAGL